MTHPDTSYSAPRIHIKFTRFTYVPRVRERGCKNYKVLKETNSLKRAWKQLSDAMASGKYKRGDILGLEPWYDPEILFKVEKS